MVFLTYFVILLFGFCVGSFLNCIIYRLEHKKSFIKARSFCPKCKHKLGIADLVPVLSFVFLGGKCRYCHKKISVQYPIVEIATGLIFLLIFNFQFSIFNQFSISEFLNFQTILNFLFLAVISCLLIIIFVYDLKHYIIPDKAVYPAIGIIFLGRLFRISNLGFFSDFGFRISDLRPLGFSLITGLSAGAFFFLIWLVSGGKWLGFGDIKLAFLLGLFLGFPVVLVGFLFAFWLGSAVGLVLIALKKKKMKSEVPFGPFLVLGTFVGLFWGERIIHWYLNIFGS